LTVIPERALAIGAVTTVTPVTKWPMTRGRTSDPIARPTRLHARVYGPRRPTPARRMIGRWAVCNTSPADRPMAMQEREGVASVDESAGAGRQAEVGPQVLAIYDGPTTASLSTFIRSIERDP